MSLVGLRPISPIGGVLRLNNWSVRIPPSVIFLCWFYNWKSAIKILISQPISNQSLKFWTILEFIRNQVFDYSLNWRNFWIPVWVKRGYFFIIFCKEGTWGMGHNLDEGWQEHLSLLGLLPQIGILPSSVSVGQY